MPKWATGKRKAYLLLLTQALFRLGPNALLAYPIYHRKVENAIGGWVDNDRTEREAKWRMELERMHRVPDRKFRQGRFDTIRRAEFLTQQPPYYLVATGVDALTFRPVAKVRIPSTYIVLFVDISPAQVSKNARRKASRYGKPLEKHETVGRLIEKAVADWWNR